MLIRVSIHVERIWGSGQLYNQVSNIRGVLYVMLTASYGSVNQDLQTLPAELAGFVSSKALAYIEKVMPGCDRLHREGDTRLRSPAKRR